MSRIGTLAVVAGLVLMFGCSSSEPTAPKSTVVVNANPNAINAPWSLIGPGGFSTSGSGDATLSDLDAGNYTLTWEEVNGWSTPSRNPHNLTVAQGGTVTFSGTYVALNVDVVIINPQPDEINADWDLVGPGSFTTSGQGDMTLTNMASGQYILTWGNVSGWAEPNINPMTLNLTAGGFIEFLGQYEELPPINTITIRINPSFILAMWDLEWPTGQHTVSSGDSSLVEMPSGSYTITWGDELSYETPEPNPHTQLLQQDGAIIFLGNYSRFVRIEAGVFTMGSPNNEPGHIDGDEQRHQVTLTRPFYISKTEVTQQEWDAVVPDSLIPNPSHFAGCDNCPVESVSWFDAIQYCNFRSQAEGYTSAYDTQDEAGVIWIQDADGYRLPTEAEWEYVCRAGTNTAYFSGDIVFANDDPNICYPDEVLDEVGFYCFNSGNQTHPVGTKTSNAWDLFDVHGNVWEWCWDVYGPYPTSAVTDPTGPPTGNIHVIRGGAWSLRAQICRSAQRGKGTQNKRLEPRPTQGFRVVRTIFE